MTTNAIQPTVGDPNVVSDGLSFPTSLTFSPDGTAYVAESGLPFGGAPRGGRVWRIERDGARSLLVDGLQPPVNGLVYHDNALIVSGGDQPGYISRLDLDGRLTTILGGLPGPGNYHTNMVVVGPDEKVDTDVSLTTVFGEPGEEDTRISEFRTCLKDIRLIVGEFGTP